MNVLSKKIFLSKSIGSLGQPPCSLYSAAATHDRSLCSVPRRGDVGRFHEFCLATRSSHHLSRGRVTGRRKISKINSIFIDTIPCKTHGPITEEEEEEEEERFKNLIKAKEKTAKIHVYVQDALGGTNPTVWEVARSVQTANSPTIFGQIRVLDDLVTAGPDRDSEKLGRAQGLITSSDLIESALTMNLTFYFNGGEYKGSSICVGGRNPINNKNRELPITGGSGVFRMVRGYAISNTYSFDPATNYGVLDYTFYVAYPDIC